MNLTFFDFTEEDLRSNQRGFVTASQKKWLEGFAHGIVRSHRGGWPIIIFFLLLGSGMILALNLSNESTRRAFFADPIILIVLCATFPLVLGIYGVSAIFARRRATRLTDAELKTAEGIVSLDEESSRVGTTYYVYVGETEFKFGEDVSAIFPEGRRCRIHYCETSMLKMILSYELLG